MTLFRLFPFDPDAPPREEGGPLFVPRRAQGVGRHDGPELYGALYLAREPVSAVAELVRRFRGRAIEARHLRWERGRPFALARFDETRLGAIVDLDDAGSLIERRLRPSAVATRDRERTQAIARSLYAEGIPGFSWWSTIEASWINVTLFAERALPRLQLASEPEPLAIDQPVVREAAEAVGVAVA